MKIVINTCFGGFGLSDAAYEKLIEWGIPARPYIEQKRDPKTKLYLPEPRNEGEIIFDREHPEDQSGPGWGRRYWETWLSGNRTHPFLLRVVEELGAAANGRHARLKIVVVPEGVDWEIDEYDGNECVAEKHRSWA